MNTLSNIYKLSALAIFTHNTFACNLFSHFFGISCVRAFPVVTILNNKQVTISVSLLSSLLCISFHSNILEFKKKYGYEFIYIYTCMG